MIRTLLPSVIYVLFATGFSADIFSRMGCHPCLIAKVSVNSGRTEEKKIRVLKAEYTYIYISYGTYISAHLSNFMKSI